MAEHKLPPPYVAFFSGPDGRNDRFQVQGMIDREYIGCAVQALVDLLDVIDGDPDIEDDDPAGIHDEDGINTLFAYDIEGGAGCPIADPGGCEHDGREPDDGY